MEYNRNEFPAQMASKAENVSICWRQHDLLVTKVGCKDLPDSDRGDFLCRRAVNSSSWS